MALTREQERYFLRYLDGETIGRWVASLEGGGAAGEFIYLFHPDLADANIAATPEWEGTDQLQIDYQYHGDDYDPSHHKCNRTLSVPWSGHPVSDGKRWRAAVLDFIACASRPGGPLHGLDHGLPRRMRLGPQEWDAGAKARRDAIFRHMLGLDDNPGYGPVRPGRVPTWVAPPEAAQAIARHALERQKELAPSRRGGLSKAKAGAAGITSGRERAESIARGDWQPAEDLRDFFNRFQGTYTGSLDKDWEHSKVQQAWDLWGGEPMREAATRRLAAEANPIAATKRRLLAY
jgi:hypothetical protein